MSHHGRACRAPRACAWNPGAHGPGLHVTSNHQYSSLPCSNAFIPWLIVGATQGIKHIGWRCIHSSADAYNDSDPCMDCKSAMSLCQRSITFLPPGVFIGLCRQLLGELLIHSRECVRAHVWQEGHGVLDIRARVEVLPGSLPLSHWRGKWRVQGLYKRGSCQSCSSKRYTDNHCCCKLEVLMSSYFKCAFAQQEST